MRFFTALIALASAALALEDGAYLTHVHPNGTVISYDAVTGALVETLTEGPLVDSYREAFANKTREKTRRELSKRFTSCWGTPLDRFNVDFAVGEFKAYIGSWGSGGYTLCAVPPANAYYSKIVGQVRIYYCINTNNWCGNIDLVDVNWALLQMDTHCAPYTSSYFQWDGSPEIIGKALVTTAVCLG